MDWDIEICANDRDIEKDRDRLKKNETTERKFNILSSSSFDVVWVAKNFGIWIPFKKRHK